MPRIRMLRALSGVVVGHKNPRRGDELDVSFSAALVLCKKGFAEPVGDAAEEKPEPVAEPAVEVAVPDDADVETATPRRRRRKSDEQD